MVGVPGRSKGCARCRKRRVACDLLEPQCTACTKSGKICGGYAREYIFVPNKKGTHQAVYEKSLGCSTVTSRASNLPAATRPFSLYADSSTDGYDILGHSPPRPLDSSIQLGHQLLTNLASFFLEGLSPDVSLALPWTRGVPLLEGTTAGLTAPSLAYCMALVGRDHNDAALLERSMQFYLQGLGEVQRALWDPNRALQDQTLAACMGLVLYELFECPDKTMQAFNWHHQGCSRLIKLRGAKAHQLGLSHEMFLTFRLHGILTAIGNHAPSYLCSPPWTTVPWKHKAKEPYDRLIDILALVPNILSQVDRITQTALDSLPATMLDLIHQCLSIDSKLSLFLLEYQRNQPSQLFWYEQFPAGDALLEPCKILFCDLQTARVMLLYWAFLAILWEGLGQLYNALEEHAPQSKASLPALGERENWILPVQKVCHSVAYCISSTQTSSTRLRVFVIAAPLNMIVNLLKGRDGYEKEYEWVLQTRNTVVGHSLKIVEHS